MSRSIHLTNACRTASKHLGAFFAVGIKDFVAVPVDHRCKRCLASRTYALHVKSLEQAPSVWSVVAEHTLKSGKVLEMLKDQYGNEASRTKK